MRDPNNNPTSYIAWLAGLLEGEGCFTYQCSPTIRVGMTDKDVVQRIAALFGRHVRGPYKYRDNMKPVYYTEVNGAVAVDWMQTILGFMGKRRSVKIREVLKKWDAAPTKAHKIGTGNVAECHPHRRHYAFGLCSACYKRAKRNGDKFPKRRP